MNIKGPLKITIEGPRGSGKTLIGYAIKKLTNENKISCDFYHEGAKVLNHGQTITIIEKQS